MLFTLSRDAHNIQFAFSLTLHRSSILELFPPKGQRCLYTSVHAFESNYVVIVVHRAILELIPLRRQRCQKLLSDASSRRSLLWKILPVRRQRCRDKIVYASYRIVVSITLPSLVWLLLSVAIGKVLKMKEKRNIKNVKPLQSPKRLMMLERMMLIIKMITFFMTMKDLTQSLTRDLMMKFSSQATDQSIKANSNMNIKNLCCKYLLI